MNDTNVIERRMKIKSRGIVPHDDGILVTQLKYKNNKFWTLPGGTLNPGETVEECAIREIKEETSLYICIERLLYVYDLMGNFNYAIEVAFLGKIKSGRIKKGMNPEPYPSPTLENVRFMSFSELRESVFYVPELIPILEKDYNNGFQGAGRYLGKYRYIE